MRGQRTKPRGQLAVRGGCDDQPGCKRVHGAAVGRLTPHELAWHRRLFMSPDAFATSVALRALPPRQSASGRDWADGFDWSRLVRVCAGFNAAARRLRPMRVLAGDPPVTVFSSEPLDDVRDGNVDIEVRLL